MNIAQATLSGRP